PNVRGVDIEVSDQGAGLPFFWGHGLVSSMEQEDRFLVMSWAHLARRYRVIRWDARGHGLSGGAPVPDDYRWDNLGRDPIALADFADRFSPVPQVSEPLLPAVLRGAASSDLPPEEAVRRVTAPALLLPWVSDDGHPLSTSERLLELLPNVQIHVAYHLRDVGTW